MSKTGLVVFAFGCPSTIYSNEVLANLALQWWKLYRGLIFSQEDVPISMHLPHSVRLIGQLPDQPPSTLKIAREAMYWARDDARLQELHVLAARPLLERCLRDLELAKAEQRSLITITECSSPDQIPFDQWFCRDSQLPQTRSLDAWERRERVIRRMPIWLYKLMAS